jgi:hypothetical protein
MAVCVRSHSIPEGERESEKTAPRPTVDSLVRVDYSRAREEYSSLQL